MPTFDYAEVATDYYIVTADDGRSFGQIKLNPDLTVDQEIARSVATQWGPGFVSSRPPTEAERVLRIQAEIFALESSQARAIREAILYGTLAPLQAIEDQIVALRNEL